jgi:iron complex transport system permease protein
MARLDPGRFPIWLAAAAAALVALIGWSLAAGRFPVSVLDVWRALWAAFGGAAEGLSPDAQAIVTQVRAPRVAAAVVVGAALAAAGAAYQSLFRNALASPDILGVSAGCALGAALAVLLSLPAAAVQGFAFAGGLAAVTLVVAIGSWVRGPDTTLTLILTGVVVGALFGAGIAMVKYVADPHQQLPALTFWLLGSFADARAQDVAFAIVPMALGLAPLALLRHRIDLLSLSDDEARALGVRVGRLRFTVIAAATLATAAAVSVAGTIAWVGLVIPHAARLIGGPRFARVLALSLVLGAAFMLAVDTLARVAFATEIPPGAVTAFIGTPAFLLLLAASLRR